MTFAANQPTAWPLPADWSSPVKETLEWLTDVLLANRTPNSQVRALRGAPRRSFVWRTLTDAASRRLSELLAAERGVKPWYIPIWPDVQRLTAPLSSGSSTIPIDTVGRDFYVGGYVLIWRNLRGWELLEVDEVYPDNIHVVTPTSALWDSSARIYPTRPGRVVESAEWSYLTADASEADTVAASIFEYCDWPAAMPTDTVYRTYPVMEWKPNWAEAPSASAENTILVTDNETSYPYLFDMIERSLRSQQARWSIHNREEYDKWRSMLYYLAGRSNPVWVPSWTSDLKLIANIGSGAATITVEWSGYTLYGLNKPSSQDICIELTNGTKYYRRITNSTVSGNNEILTLNAAIPTATPANTVRMISYVRLCTLASDSVEIEHLTDSEGVSECTLSWMEVQE